MPLRKCLIVVEQGLTFAIFADDILAVTKIDVLAEEAWNTNGHAENGQNTSDGNRELPLQSNNMSGELCEGKC